MRGRAGRSAGGFAVGFRVVTETAGAAGRWVEEPVGRSSGRRGVSVREPEAGVTVAGTSGRTEVPGTVVVPGAGWLPGLVGEDVPSAGTPSEGVLDPGVATGGVVVPSGAGGAAASGGTSPAGAVPAPGAGAASPVGVGPGAALLVGGASGVGEAGCPGCAGVAGAAGAVPSCCCCCCRRRRSWRRCSRRCRSASVSSASLRCRRCCGSGLFAAPLPPCPPCCSGGADSCTVWLCAPSGLLPVTGTANAGLVGGVASWLCAGREGSRQIHAARARPSASSTGVRRQGGMALPEQRERRIKTDSDRTHGQTQPRPDPPPEGENSGATRTQLPAFLHAYAFGGVRWSVIGGR